MLTLTENAQTVMTGIVASAGAPATGGIRIAQDPAGDRLLVSVAAEPAPEDRIVEQAGVKVFLDAAAAEVLDDRVLDASASSDGHVDFAVQRTA